MDGDPIILQFILMDICMNNLQQWGVYRNNRIRAQASRITLRKSMMGRLNLLLISKVSQRQKNVQIFGINPYLFLLLCTILCSHDNTLSCSKAV